MGCGRTPACVGRCGVLAVLWVREARERHAFRLQALEARYERAGTFGDRRLPPKAVVITSWQSESVRFYSGRRMLAWDALNPAWVDGVVEYVRTCGLAGPNLSPRRSGAVSPRRPADDRIRAMRIVVFGARGSGSHRGCSARSMCRCSLQPSVLRRLGRRSPSSCASRRITRPRSSTVSPRSSATRRCAGARLGRIGHRRADGVDRGDARHPDVHAGRSRTRTGDGDRRARRRRGPYRPRTRCADAASRGAVPASDRNRRPQSSGLRPQLRPGA